MMCFKSSDWLTPAVIDKLRPFKNIFLGISVVALVFSVLIIIENVIFIAEFSRQNPLLLLLPYLLSWILILLAVVFGRFAYILYNRQHKNFVSVVPTSAWTTESRSTSPCPSQEFTTTSYNSLLFRNLLAVPTSPFYISDAVSTYVDCPRILPASHWTRYSDEPPTYSEVTVGRASPIPSGNEISPV